MSDERRMDFNKFVLYLKGNIKKYLPEDYQDADVYIGSSLKNNNIHKTSISVIKAGENIGATVYAEDYFSEYAASGEIERTMIKLGSILQLANPDINVNDLLDYEKVKNSIVFSVVNTAENEERLEHLPHKEIKDLSIIYEIDVNINSDKGSIKITNSLMERLGVSSEELHATAMLNTERLYPGSVRNMNDVMTEIMVEKLTAQAMMTGIEFSKEAIEKTAREMFSISGAPGEPPMYVVTNNKTINGAGVLFYPGMMDKIAGELKGSFYVVPSSVHEVIVIPDTKDIAPETLNEMIQEVNHTQLLPDEYLSDHSYYYDTRIHELLTDKEYGFVKEIIRDIKNEGYTPTRKLVSAMLKSAQLCGFVCEIEDLRKAQNLKVITGEPRAVITAVINELNRQDAVQKPPTPPVPEGN